MILLFTIMQMLYHSILLIDWRRLRPKHHVSINNRFCNKPSLIYSINRSNTLVLSRALSATYCLDLSIIGKFQHTCSYETILRMLSHLSESGSDCKTAFLMNFKLTFFIDLFWHCKILSTVCLEKPEHIASTPLVILT